MGLEEAAAVGVVIRAFAVAHGVTVASLAKLLR